MLDEIKPGQTLTCTVTSVPRSKGGRETIARLMRQDPTIAKGLRAAQEHRARTMRWKIRGGRRWFQRPKASKVVQVQPGESWTMRLYPQITADLTSVKDYLKIEAQ